MSNFLSVTRARPEDADDDHAGEDFSDEELHVNKHNFRDALKTSMGKGPRNKDANEEEASGDDEQAPKTTLEAFESARTMWPVPENCETPGPCPGTSDIAPEKLAKALAAASASQKRENVRETTDRDMKEPKFRPDHRYTAQDVWSWFEKKKS